MNMKAKINDIKKQAVIADLALGFEPEIEVPHKWDVVDDYAKHGFTYVAIALAGEFTSLETAIKYISRQRAKIQSEDAKYSIVKNVKDIYDAKRKNKLALGFWLQGSNPIANDIHMVETFYQLGVRTMLLCYNTRNAIGDGIIEKVDGGLSKFGYKVIEEMNRVGMLIDLSHGGIKTSLETIEASNVPVIFSHSNAYALVPHPRNLTDEQIIAVARKGGVVGVNGMAMLLGVTKSSSEKLAEQIDYIANLTSVENVALGLDQIYFYDILNLFYERAGLTTYPKGYIGSMDSYQPKKIDELIENLLKRNYKEAAIEAILGGNFLRVAEQVWK